MQISESQKIVVLVNETAGTAREGGESLRAALSSSFAKRGVMAEVTLVRGDDLQSQAERARDRALVHEIDGIVVGGGDGSIRTVAGLLADTGVPLGVLPFGTLNHFAKDLGIPVDLDGAIDVIAAANPHAVDIAEVNGQTFVNNSSIGIYPYMVLDRERRRRMHCLSKWRAMFFAVLRTLRYFPLHRVSISAEGWNEPCRTPCVFIGNNRYSFVAPSLGARERLDGGHLCLSVAQQQSRLALLWLACRSAFGLLDEARDLRSLEVGSAQITSRTSRLLVSMDGEVAILRPPLRYRIRPKALHVFVSVPRTH